MITGPTEKGTYACIKQHKSLEICGTRNIPPFYVIYYYYYGSSFFLIQIVTLMYTL